MVGLPYNGAGMLAPLVGIFAALFMNVLSYRAFGYDYYEKHRWPKLSIFVLAGGLCLLFGIWLKKKRKRDANKPNPQANQMAAGLDREDYAFDGSRDGRVLI
jgi:hypothetical protein